MPPFPTGYNNNYQIVQTPDTVAIRYEMMAETRIVPIDGRPHSSPAIRRGWANPAATSTATRWSWRRPNYNDKATFRFPAINESLRVIERFTRTSDDRIDYQFTVDNPAMYTRPWTAILPMAGSKGRSYEYACHEATTASPTC